LPTTTYYDLKTLPDIWDANVEQEWLVDHMIPKSSVTTLTGESGSGKSSVVLALAYAVATGVPFAGRETKQTPVLFVDGENGLYVYTERFKRFDIKPTPNMKFWGIWNNDLSPQGPDYQGVIEYAKEFQPVIIYDSLVAFHPGSEQDSSETRAYMNLFRKLSSLGATVIVLHHTGKGESTHLYRGSSDIPASSDTCWLLLAKKPLLKHITLTSFKSREGILENIDLTLDGQTFVEISHAFVAPDDVDWVKVAKVVSDNPGCNQSQIIELLPDVPLQKVRKLLMVGEQTKRFSTERGQKNALLYSISSTNNTK
jgi:hypothetical protein